MKNIEVKSLSVRRLWQKLDERVFAVPELQREFVWDIRKACGLLDSIYKNMPIGSLMIWDAHGDFGNHLRHARHILPEHDPKKRSIWFLLDGQQRLSVLHRIRKGDNIENYSGKLVDFGRIYFCLKKAGASNEANGKTKQQKSRFVKLVRPDPDQHVKVTDVLSSSWRRIFKGLPKYKLRQIEECRNQITSYKVPTVFMETKDVDEVREAFIRVNSHGMKVSNADRAFARAADFNLRHLVRVAKGGWRNGFNKLPDETVLMTLALVNDVKQVGSAAVDIAIGKIEKQVKTAGGKKAFTKEWRRLRDCLGQAIDYLRHTFHVVNYDFLPSSNMVAVLAAFFFWNKARPKKEQKDELAKWFWATGVGQRYTGYGYNRNIIEDVEFFKLLTRNVRRKFKLANPINRHRILSADYSNRTSLANAFFCLLINQKPRYVENGGRIPVVEYSARSNRKEKHHIFARALLQRHSFGRNDYNSICNICFMVSDENQSFGSKKPLDYLGDFRRRRTFSKTMKSHLIPHGPKSGLWLWNPKKGYPAFLKERCDMICKAFEQAAGMKLFRAK